MSKTSLTPTEIIETLKDHYGSQGWWPLLKGRGNKTPPAPQYHQGPPQSARDQWEIITGAILTQNTNWKNVEKALSSLGKKRCLNISQMASRDRGEIEELIQSSGYYRQKARRLQKLARYFRRNSLASRGELTTEKLRQELLARKGIGPETADSILLYAFGRKKFVIDAYTKRIFGRLGYKNLSSDYHGLQEFLESNLPSSLSLYQEGHALFVELAKRACQKRNPQCQICPLASDCPRGRKVQS